MFQLNLPALGTKFHDGDTRRIVNNKLGASDRTDGRGAQPEFDGKSIVQEVYEKTGLTVSTGFGLVTHLYHCRKGIVPEGAATFCSIGDYLGMKLTGRKTPLVHASNAGSFGLNLFDSEKGEFRKAVL